MRGSPDVSNSRDLIGLVGIYDANGSIPGEISYWLGARLGRKHCALCEITHGIFREKREWRECASGLSVPFEALHLDELSPGLSEVVIGEVPCVVGVYSNGAREIVIGRNQLEGCHGQPEALERLIEALS